MSVRVWLHRYDEKLLASYSEATLKYYAGEGNNELVTGNVKSGSFAHLQSAFVLGKVRFFEREGSEHRTPFVRVDNHVCWPHGAYFTSHIWINVRYHGKSKTVDENTMLTRIEMLSAPENDFIHRVFVTYDCDGLVPKPREHDKHFLVYCDEIKLDHGRVDCIHF